METKITRRAVLLSEMAETGVAAWAREEAVRLKDFLRTSVGGAWESGEILDDIGHTRAEIFSALETCRDAGFVLLFFAGRGETVKNGFPWPETRIFPNPNESIFVERELNPGNPRVLFILDTIPVKERGGLEPRKEIPGAAAAAEILDSEKTRASRILYEQALLAAEMGTATVQPETMAGVSRNGKETFLRNLVETACEWSVNAEAGSVLLLPDAARLAAARCGKKSGIQKPHYNGGRRLGHFPFAISTR